MIIRYLTYLIFIQGVYGVLGNLFLFPIAYLFRNKIRRNNRPKLLWGLLHDTTDANDWGDIYFNPSQKRNFLTAWGWVWRNPIHNWQQSHAIIGAHTGHKGWATIQAGKRDLGIAWRTLKTCDEDGTFRDKYGPWIDTRAAILGKQRITFAIAGKRYFRYSGAVPRRIFGKWWWIPEYKFGFETKSWVIQFHPFTFKKYDNEINYERKQVNQQ